MPVSATFEMDGATSSPVKAPRQSPGSDRWRELVATSWRSRRPQVIEALLVAWVPWAIARAVVLGTLVFAKFEVRHFHISNAMAVRVTRQGLLSWDGAWYQAIAAHGYRAAGHDSLRFFPLLPLAGQVLHDVSSMTVGAAVLVVVNVCSLLAAMALYQLVKSEFGDEVVARRAAWLLCLVPSAFVFVMGYAESLAVMLAVGCFYCLRRRYWWWAAGFGFVAGLSRPICLLLVVPASVEVLRPSSKRIAGRAMATAAPLVGAAAFLAWSAVEFHDFFAPLTDQFNSSLHGRMTDPLITLWHASVHLAHGRHIDTGLFWAAAVIVLLIVTFRRLPVSYGLFALAISAAAISGRNLDSFERYALSAFPLVMGASTLLSSERVAMTVFLFCVAGMVGYSLLAFQGAFVP